MTFRLAHDDFTLEHGCNTVTLRPSLRAASYLEARYGFTTLFRHVDEFNLTTIREIILAASQSRQNAAAFLLCIAGMPLSLIAGIVTAPVADLCRTFIPAPVQPSSTAPAAKGKPWAEHYADLYGMATGWLGWTPETAWSATPTEIERAYAAHLDRLEITGVISRSKQTDKAPDPEQAARNVAAGLDAEFDRAGVEALRGSIARAGR